MTIIKCDTYKEKEDLISRCQTIGYKWPTGVSVSNNSAFAEGLCYELCENKVMVPREVSLATINYKQIVKMARKKYHKKGFKDA